MDFNSGIAGWDARLKALCSWVSASYSGVSRLKAPYSWVSASYSGVGHRGTLFAKKEVAQIQIESAPLLVNITYLI
jgi:hypothetical protein